MSYFLLKIQQGSKQWHDWRFDGLGASDALIVLGQSKFKSADQLLEEKCDRFHTRPVNSAMLAGISNESEARHRYENKIRMNLEPICVQHKNYSFLRASLDAYNGFHRKVVEIKCGEGNYYNFQNSRSIPWWHKPQLQYILAILGYETIDVWCWHPGVRGISRTVKRDDKYIEQLVDRCQEFWFKVQLVRARRQ